MTRKISHLNDELILIVESTDEAMIDSWSRLIEGEHERQDRISPEDIKSYIAEYKNKTKSKHWIQGAYLSPENFQDFFDRDSGFYPLTPEEKEIKKLVKKDKHVIVMYEKMLMDSPSLLEHEIGHYLWFKYPEMESDYDLFFDEECPITISAFASLKILDYPEASWKEEFFVSMATGIHDPHAPDPSPFFKHLPAFPKFYEKSTECRNLFLKYYNRLILGF